MTDENIFNTREQEAKLLNEELGEIKMLLREITRKMSQIEARARRAYPSSLPKTEKNNRKIMRQENADKPTITSQEAIRIYDEIVQTVKDGRIEDASKRLNEMTITDLNLMRVELGVTSKNNKPSKSALLKAIMGRVNESVMLTKHVNRQ